MKKTILTTTLLASLASLSQAAVIWDSIPTVGGTGEATNLGQSITTGVLGSDNILDNIIIEASTATTDGDASFTATLEIFKSTDGNFATWDPTTTLALAVSESVSMTATNNGTFNFTGANRIVLDDSSVYLIFINDTSGATRIAFSAGTVGDAVTGQSFRNVNTATGAADSLEPIVANSDFGVTVNTVPEPSSTALLGLGGLALILRRRK